MYFPPLRFSSAGCVLICSFVPRCSPASTARSRLLKALQKGVLCAPLRLPVSVDQSGVAGRLGFLPCWRRKEGKGRVCCHSGKSTGQQTHKASKQNDAPEMDACDGTVCMRGSCCLLHPAAVAHVPTVLCCSATPSAAPSMLLFASPLLPLLYQKQPCPPPLLPPLPPPPLRLPLLLLH